MCGLQCPYSIRRRALAYLLTGSLMAVKKSCACSAMGENASKMICPSSGLIHSGRDVWSSFRCNHEKSCSLNICETNVSCCRRCTSRELRFVRSFPLFLFSPASLRVRALKLIVALRGTREVSGGDGGITSSSLSISMYSSLSLFFRGRLEGCVESTSDVNLYFLQDKNASPSGPRLLDMDEA